MNPNVLVKNTNTGKGFNLSETSIPAFVGVVRRMSNGSPTNCLI